MNAKCVKYPMNDDYFRFNQAAPTSKTKSPFRVGKRPESMTNLANDEWLLTRANSAWLHQLKFNFLKPVKGEVVYQIERD